MTPPDQPALVDVSPGSIQRLHRIAHAEGWREITVMSRRAMSRRRLNGESWRTL